MLFKTEPAVANIIPVTFYKASRLASRILRSDFHKNELCEMHIDPKTFETHIDEQVLSAFLMKNEVFMVDKLRHMNMLNTLACNIRDNDLFKIYLNPLLLLEMLDKEREAAELQSTAIGQWDLKHNSLVVCHQGNNMSPTTSTPAASTCMATPANDPIIPSDLTVGEKHVWILTILLVHHADHLLNGLFSTCLVNGASPAKLMRDTDQLRFTNIGNMLELKLYGWVIRFGFNDAHSAPFAIQEVLGATHTAPNMPLRVLTPSVQMRALLTDPDDLTIPITADVLAAAVTGNGHYYQQQSSKSVDRGCSCDSASAVNNFSHDEPSATLKRESSVSEFRNVFDSWKE